MKWDKRNVARAIFERLDVRFRGTIILKIFVVFELERPEMNVPLEEVQLFLFIIKLEYLISNENS